MAKGRLHSDPHAWESSGMRNSLPADVLWGLFVTHLWNERVTNETQRTSAGGGGGGGKGVDAKVWCHKKLTFWENNIEEPHSPKTSIMRQIVSEILAQLCSDDFKILLKFDLGLNVL